MLSRQSKGKGILAKLLEKGIEILLKKECKKIGKIKIDVIASSIQLIKGIIQKIYIISEDINYKDIFFDEIELEANDLRIIFNMNNKELSFKNNFIIKFKISLSNISLKKVLLSNNWEWISDMLSKEILNQNKLEDIKIKNGQIFIKTSKDNKIINKEEKINIKTENGKLYLENKFRNKSIRIPIEDKIHIMNVNIENNLINILANSSVDF